MQFRRPFVHGVIVELSAELQIDELSEGTVVRDELQRVAIEACQKQSGLKSIAAASSKACELYLLLQS